MTYKLAKELKEAGWPQEAGVTGAYYMLPIGYTFMQEGWRKDLNQPEILCRIATLGELIAACGDGFHCLVRTVNGGIDSDREFWSAGGSDKVSDWHNGPTPDAAVAHLWLARQKKG